MRRCLCLALLVGCAHAHDFSQRYVYLQTNLQNNAMLPRFLEQLATFKQAGANGIILADWPLSALPLAQPQYAANVARFMAAAKAEGLEVIPSVFPVGWSNGLLRQDPNLAAGLPVREAPFVVRGNTAQPVLSPATRLLNGDFEAANGDRFTGWSFQDEPGRATCADHAVFHGGRTSLRLDSPGAHNPPSGNARIVQTLTVEPFQAYHASLWIRTAGFEHAASVRLAVLSDQTRFTHCYTNLDVKGTQDWTQYHLTFNSLRATQIALYLGVWGGGQGQAWFDDLTLEPAGLCNTLRRDLCPLKVTSADGATVYAEGRDFQPVVDPLLGKTHGSLGTYEPWHQPPVLALTANSRIHEGDTLGLSYWHPQVIYTESVPCSIEDPKVLDLFKAEIEGAHKLFGAKGYMLGYDEWRLGAWELDDGRTAGQKLAEHARRSIALVRAAAPGATVYAWSDMFDPHHNAVEHYYLVNGSLTGSWEGLDKGVVIVNWNLGKFARSAPFFADRGHHQIIAGYYDAPPEQVKPLVDLAAKTKGVDGLMYTTWESDFRDLAQFFQLAAAQ